MELFFTSIATATGQSYTPSALNTTTFYKRVTTAGSGTASTCVAESSIIEIKVFDLDAGALDPSLNMSYCYGADPPTIVSSITGGDSRRRHNKYGYTDISMGTIHKWSCLDRNHFSYKCGF